MKEIKNTHTELWVQLKTLCYISKQKDNAGVVLKVDGKNCHNANDIANVFNTFFTTVAAKLVEKLPPLPNVFHLTSTLLQQSYSRVISDTL